MRVHHRANDGESEPSPGAGRPLIIASDERFERRFQHRGIEPCPRVPDGDTERADVHDGILDAMYGSAADLLLLPIQDVFGWSDRINVPGVVDDHNWTWKLPWLADLMGQQPEAIARAAAVRALAACYDRLSETTT